MRTTLGVKAYMRKFISVSLLLIAIPSHGAEQKGALSKESPVDDSRAQAVEQCKLTRSEEKMVECIEQGLYDPCDYGGGIHSWIRAQCARGHATVADRKLKSLEDQIAKRLKSGGNPQTLSKFHEAQQLWRQATDNYCRFTNDAGEAQVFEASSSYLSYGFCLRRLKEQRVNELMPYVSTDANVQPER